MRRFALFVTSLTIVISLSLVASAQQCGPWQLPNGVWVSNRCVGNVTGAFWCYPPEQAKPVGFPCRLPDGQFGTAN